MMSFSRPFHVMICSSCSCGRSGLNNSGSGKIFGSRLMLTTEQCSGVPAGNSTSLLSTAAQQQEAAVTPRETRLEETATRLTGEGAGLREVHGDERHSRLQA